MQRAQHGSASAEKGIHASRKIEPRRFLEDPADESRAIEALPRIPSVHVGHAQVGHCGPDDAVRKRDVGGGMRGGAHGLRSEKCRREQITGEQAYMKKSRSAHFLTLSP